MDNLQNNNARSPTGPEPGQQAGGPYNVVFVNYTFTYSPHPQRNGLNSQDPQDISRESPGTGGNATQTAEGFQNRAQPRAEGPFHGFVVYGVPQLFDNAMFNGLGGAFGMGEPPKPHASKAAVDALKDVDLKAIPESDRTCPICFDPYYEKPAEVKGVDINMIDVIAPAKEENTLSSAPEIASLVMEEFERSHDPESRQPLLTTEAEEDAATYREQPQHESDTSKENQTTSRQSDASEHAPLEMPCGHIFGKDCLKEWLMSSTTCPLCRTAIEAEPLSPQQQHGRFDGGLPFVLAPLFSLFRQSGPNQTPGDAQNQPRPSQQQPQPPQSSPSMAPATTPTFTAPSVPQSAPVEPSVNRSSSSGSSYAVRHHPYSRPTESSTSANASTSASSTESLSSVLARPDLECDSALVGLCEERGHTIRLDCGHGYHEDCLRTLMRTHGDVDIPNLRSESNISTLTSDQPRVRREVWCMRCRRYREVDA
ncbi:hypothetical protein V1520DRAFT_344703 [Lipomyces starkeyi]|uniref:RING-type domain-containing protein n=1 Tax=Lipomyces starkeyi NRRL Y-11557 TaxID=675824 RepID=A0A1E3QFT4_LIPST|nr:hypothetical protein LIPSTDRAFT_67181 [Lipomyces starkeyi NRRL Y-11557]